MLMAKSQSELSLQAALPLLVNAKHHSHCHCEEPKATKQSQYIRGGEEKNAWPGQKCQCSGGVYLHLVGDKPRPYRNVVEGLVPS